jgi:vitamin B12 transporter
MELEVETIPMYDFTLLAGFAYIRIKPSDQPNTEITKSHTWNIGIRYDNSESFRAQLFGHYIWWNVDAALQGKYDDFIWDLHLNKKIYATEKTVAEIFLTAHNIFNGSQYLSGDYKNPRRWIEAGLTFKF